MLFIIIIIIYKTNNSINKTIIHDVKETKETKYTNIYYLTPYQSTTLSTNYNTSNYLLKYPSNINQKPWFKPWTNGKNQFLCYLDKHLNRRCIWTCPNKCA